MFRMITFETIGYLTNKIDLKSDRSVILNETTNKRKGA